MSSEVLMRLENVSKIYHMGEVEVHALDQASLEIKTGELVVLVGPSGSGKSTLLNLMGGMDVPTCGRISYLGNDLSHAGDKELTLFRRNEVGFVFQFYNLIPDLTAAENIALAAEMASKPLPIDEVLQEVGLLERSRHFPSQLSGGEQQRISIARAIVKRPRLLLCDEPTGALDFQSGKMILSYLKKINSDMNTTVIIVTHNTVIAAMADRVIHMGSGKIVKDYLNEKPLSPERIEW